MDELPCDTCELYNDCREIGGVAPVGVWNHFLILAREGLQNEAAQAEVRARIANWPEFSEEFFDHALDCAQNRLDGNCEEND